MNKSLPALMIQIKVKIGGESEIRTRDTLRHARFPSVCTRPLCALSIPLCDLSIPLCHYATGQLDPMVHQNSKSGQLTSDRIH